MKKLYRLRAKKKIIIQTVRIKHSLALPDRAESVAKYLRTLNGVFRQLLSDENFVTLLRAESIAAIPGYLEPLVKKGEDGHEIC